MLVHALNKSISVIACWHCCCDQACTNLYLEFMRHSILVVEDEPTFRRYLEFQLKNSLEYEFDAAFAASAEEGLAILRKQPSFDFILVDYFLPGMNGEMFLRQVVKISTSAGIICISENRDYKIAVDLLKAGADDYISKSDLRTPYALEKTIASVEQKKEYKKRSKDLEIIAQRLDAIHNIVQTVDHELNNPLAIIKLCTEIIHTRQTLTSDDCKELTRRILTSITRISDVIHRLNQFQVELPNETLAGPQIYALPELVP